jgi:3-phosphoshikimate 1-carboxyvinyltransferase
VARLKIYPQEKPLTGVVDLPGDKSISHRAVMLSGLANGISRVRGWLPAGDTLATLEAIRALGVDIDTEARSNQGLDLRIIGKGLNGLQRPAEPLDCRNAGTCLRLLAGILSGQPFPSILDGTEQLRRRPMGRIVRPLRQMGARIDSAGDRAPLHIKPASLHGIDYALPIASAQVKSAILLAGLYAQGPTRIHEPGPARDHTERMLKAMGSQIQVEGSTITLSPDRSGALAPLDMKVPGDLSSAAFLLVAAALVPHSNITVRGVGLNQTRSGLLDILSDMGARVVTDNERESGGEPSADLSILFNELHSTAVGGRLVVRAIDEFPVWAVAATQAAGESSLAEAAELRVKEVDRIHNLALELGRMGTEIAEKEDGLTVSGPIRLRGAQVNSYGDHRLGMALAVAGLAATEPTIVIGAGCINDSFPGFVDTMGSLGARMEWLD